VNKATQLDVYHVPAQVVQTTRDFLYERGLDGCEGTALWIGCPNGSEILVTRVLIPEQRCIKTEYGVAVELTEKAHYTLTDHLAPGERFYIRIHSHPGRAYHSKTDDANAVITHQGAISIVVPNFAVAPLTMTTCAVYRLDHDRGWLPLSKHEIDRTFQVTA
jgi:hypothetical protein